MKKRADALVNEVCAGVTVTERIIRNSHPEVKEHSDGCFFVL